MSLKPWSQPAVLASACCLLAKTRAKFWDPYVVFRSEEREAWSGRLDFLATAISFTMPLGVLWRFPYLVYKSGGEVFFGTFIFFMVVVGLPLVFFEISIGQFSSSGPLTCWKLSPIFQGAGLAMVLLSAITAIYHSVILAMAVYYLFASFTSELPWAKCGNEWNSECIGTLPEGIDCSNYGWNASADGGCYDENYLIKAIWNMSGSASSTYRYEMSKASTEYFHRHVLRDHNSSGLDDLGPVVWHLALCNLLVWVVLAVILSKSVKLYAKVSYFTTICPLVILAILFVFGLTLDGHYEGYLYYRLPNGEKIHDYITWKDAAVQVFFSLSLSFGGLITLGSYNRFNSDTYRDSAIICTMNIITSILSGFTVFFFFGALAKYFNAPMASVVDSGVGLAFVAMPQYWTITSVPTFWSIVWFLLVICLALGPQLGYVETVITSILDVFPKLRRFRLFVVISVCSVFFLLGLTCTTEGGIHMITFVDVTCVGWSYFLIPIMELTALLTYGIPRFLNDVETMTGSRFIGCLPVILGKFWMGFYLYLPALAAVLFINIVIRIDPWEPEWPVWAQRLGKTINWTYPVCFIGGAILAIIMSIIKNCRTNRKNWCSFVTPSSGWGPALVEHRSRVTRYVPWFTVDPRTQGPDEDVTALHVVSQ